MKDNEARVAVRATLAVMARLAERTRTAADDSTHSAPEGERAPAQRSGC